MQSSAAITFLEHELKRGNQSFVSKRFVRLKMTRPDSDAWDLHNTSGSCKDLPDLSRPVHLIPEVCSLSSQASIWTTLAIFHIPLSSGTAIEAGMEIRTPDASTEWIAVS